jgi:hypothetical protein
MKTKKTYTYRIKVTCYPEKWKYKGEPQPYVFYINDDDLTFEKTRVDFKDGSEEYTAKIELKRLWDQDITIKVSKWIGGKNENYYYPTVSSKDALVEYRCCIGKSWISNKEIKCVCEYCGYEKNRRYDLVDINWENTHKYSANIWVNPPIQEYNGCLIYKCQRCNKTHIINFFMNPSTWTVKNCKNVKVQDLGIWKFGGGEIME